MTLESPPSYAWDWLARQRVAWREIRRRLLLGEVTATRSGTPAPAGPAGPAGPATAHATAGPARASGPAGFGPVPDWSADHPDVLPFGAPRIPAHAPTDAGQVDDLPLRHDYTGLDTRAAIIAALREDYSADEAVRRTVDAVVSEVAFLGRLDVPLHALGVRTAPRGMRWWWCHLGGTGLDDGRDSANDADGDAVGDEATLPAQLRLVDVLSGYGDAPGV